MPARYRLGVDIGGTFTDATLINEDSGEIRIAKVLSTPSDPSQGFLEATERILEEASLTGSDVSRLVHATTVATNAIIEGKSARTGFVTTAGFRDMLEIARQNRPTLYDPLFEKPTPIVSRDLCFGVPERLDSDGRVVTPLDEDALREAGEQLRTKGVQAVAVCFLHAYVESAHEKRALAVLKEVCPDAAISISSEVAPEFREYFRASTTVINAAVRPVVARYLENIETQLADAGVTVDLLVMQSSGGVYTSTMARENPVYMVESGPAAGVIAASHFGEIAGFSDVISFDMGGTTAKVGLVQDGQPRITKEYEVGAEAKSRAGADGGGYPIRTPVIDLVEIGAGGGSIAWVDSGGVLRVGPQSAGADPGPSCYGRGGTEPTVTDANLVLGRLNPRYFLGGEIVLDVEAARQAISDRCARPLKMDLVEAANGIVEIANTAMVNALRLVTIQRGYDPREFALVAFGGAGPVHANRLAAEMGVREILVPLRPGIASSLGLLVTDLKREYVRNLFARSSALDTEELDATILELEEQGAQDLLGDGFSKANMSFLRQLDMRYVGQSFELPVQVPAGALNEAALKEAVVSFHDEHDRAYGYSAHEEAVEVVSVRLTAIGEMAKLATSRLETVTDGDSDALKEKRDVYFAENEGYVECAVYDRYRLRAPTVIHGPAVVEELDSATVIHPGFRGTVDAYGNLILREERPK